MAAPGGREIVVVSPEDRLESSGSGSSRVSICLVYR